MPLFHIKTNAALDLTPRAAIVCGYVLARWTELGLGSFVLTATKEPRQSGLHPTGDAFDLRTRQFFSSGKHDPKILDFRLQMRNELRPFGVDVVLHPEDDALGKEKPPHFHFEVDEKPAEGRILMDDVP